jgi:taurine dioxygenase
MTDLVVRELSPAIGAEIAGIDPSRELDDETVAQLRQLFDDRSVLVFRDVDLAPQDQAYLAGLLVSAVAPADRDAAEANAVIYETHISNQPGGNAPYGELLYHSDMMWADEPVQLLSLYGLEVEQPSVPTIYASAVRAWDTLPDDLRARVDGRMAVHVTGQQPRGETNNLLQSQHETVRSTTKPVAQCHPRTGRTLLYVSQMMTSEVEGLPSDESEALLEDLFAHLYDPTYSWTHEWRERDLVVWDNLAVQHARPDLATGGPVRTLRKVIAPVPDAALGRMKAPTFTRNIAAEGADRGLPRPPVVHRQR